MLRKDKWPFTPERLSEILDAEMLSVIEAGCCARIGRAMTIVDVNPTDEHPKRVDAVNHLQNFEPFCGYLRNSENFEGGNAACEQCDVRIAKAVTSIDKDRPYRRYTCHMGLLDSRYIVQVRGHAVGVLFSGQFRPAHGIEHIRESVHAIGTPVFPNITAKHASAQSKLIQLSEGLKNEVNNFQENLRKEASLIQHIAEAKFQQTKSEWELEFLNQLRSARSFGEPKDLQEVNQQASVILEQVRKFCRCQYVILFANLQATDTVLSPIANAGVTSRLHTKLPHFNWKKAGLPIQTPNTLQQDLTNDHVALSRGIRGDNVEYFSKPGAVLAVVLSQSYRTVLLFGPFDEPIRLEQEREFLYQIGRIVGWAIHTEMQMLALRKQQKEMESKTRLVTHQVRTTLTPISTYIGTVKHLIRRPANESSTKMIANSLDAAQRLCMHLGAAVDDTVKSAVLLQEREDLKFENYPLSVLVANCAEGFVTKANQKQRHFIIDGSIEYLPSAEVDIARLTIALSNLLDNAVKYSYPNTQIVVRAKVHGESSLDLHSATIEIQNDGDEIPVGSRDRIFEQGERGLTGAKLRKIPGTGLGLWEARAVIELHNGKIQVKCVPTSHYYRQNQAFRAIFTIRLPLRQS